MSYLSSLARNGIDLASFLAAEGRVFYASDADQNDLVTGQTSFAATTPTFIIDVPTDTVVVPLMVSLNQTGVVAGGAVDIILEIDNADRYASGGTAETVLGSRTTGAVTNAATLYSGATANAGYGVRINGVTVGQDVSTAEGVVNEYLWTPSGGYDFVVGPGGFLVYTYAGTTGPTWFWSIKWGEFPSSWLN
jgi:hypothetical protein